MDVHSLADEISQHAQCETIIFLAVCTNNVLFFCLFLNFKKFKCILASLFVQIKRSIALNHDFFSL